MSAATKDRTKPRPRGRPPIGPRTQLRMDADQTAHLDRLAAERGTTRSALIREAVEQVYGTPNNPR